MVNYTAFPAATPGTEEGVSPRRIHQENDLLVIDAVGCDGLNTTTRLDQKTDLIPVETVLGYSSTR